MILKSDCKYFPGDRPCKFHKKEKVICTDCPYYKPAGSLILIIKLDAIGDVLRTTSILHALKEKYPDSFIVWLTKENAKDIFRLNPLVDEVKTVESPNLTSDLSLINFDLIINLDPSHVSSSLASIAKSESRIGFGLNGKGKVFPFNTEAEEWFEMGAFDSFKAKNTKTYQQIIHEICSLDYKKGKIIFNLSEDEIKTGRKFYEFRSLSKFDKIIGINAGASNRWQFKKWRKEGYISLIKQLSKEYNCAFLLFGGKNETELNKELMKAAKNIFDTGSGNTLRELASYINLVDVLITGDTLALHIAAALEKQVVCIFGPTSCAEIEDYGIVTKVVPEMDCLVCYKNTCDFKPNCMELVTGEMIYNTVKTILDR
jgi:ADP-heptose:LPS heptosyltransferase